MSSIRHVLPIALLALFAQAPAQEKFSADWDSLKQHTAAPEWFADAKLGVYFHWGVYSVPAWGSEWYPRWMYVPDRKGWGEEIYAYHRKTYGADFDYHDFIPLWKGEKFNAKEWVDLFEGMGARFIGSIAEHHDGFSLWDSRTNEWNSVAMGPGINVVKAIADETRKRDLKFMATFHHGFNMMFYPKMKGMWPRPGYDSYRYDHVDVPQEKKYRKLYSTMSYEEANDLWLAKLNEVIEAYCPDYIWMDFGQKYVTEEHRKRFLSNYFNKAAELNKDVVVNTKGSFFPTELAVVNVERATMADITPDVWITDFILGSSWCFNQAQRTAIKPETAIRILAEVVSKNGVMLLSAGPMADGTIPVEQVQAMKGIGAWLKLYGEAIYETRPFVTFGEGPTELKRDSKDAWNEYGAIKKGLDRLHAQDIRYTRNGNIVYAIQLGWPGKSKQTTLSAFANEASDLNIASVSVPGSSETILWTKTKDGLQVRSPEKKPDQADSALVYKITLRDDDTGRLIFEDDFERSESQETKEEIGSGWSSNSKGRAKGRKQVDLRDGALYIYRHDTADHSVSVKHDAEFTDGTVQLRFMLENPGDSLGLNFADLTCKTVHAGHLCMARISTQDIQLSDLKTGKMNLELQTARKTKTLTDAQQKRLKSTEKKVLHALETGQWHDLRVTIQGDTLSVIIDGQDAASFTSEGIAHPTKRTLRLSVPKQAAVDDIQIYKKN